VQDRRRRHICTYRQARQLAKGGVRTDVSFDDARRAIDAIAANRWRAPDWLYLDPTFCGPGDNDPPIRE